MVRVKQSEFIRDRAKVTILELILSVNVGRDASADGDARRAWHDGKNPIPRDSEAIEIAQCNTCLDQVRRLFKVRVYAIVLTDEESYHELP
jgi:hypothetical protein